MKVFFIKRFFQLIKFKMKNLFLTGGSSGIGYSVLQKFSAQNWNVYSTYNTNKLKIKSLKKFFRMLNFIILICIQIVQ